MEIQKANDARVAQIYLHIAFNTCKQLLFASKFDK